MLALARQYAPSGADAEDAVQEAFVVIFQRLSEQRVEGAFAGWARQIVVRKALNGWQRQRSRRVDLGLDDIPHVPTPEASAEVQLTVAEVRALIGQLPEGCRLVLLLYSVEGYSHAEIGQQLGIGESASSAQLSRARQRLAALVAAASRERRPAPPPEMAASRAHSPAEPAAADRPMPFHPITTLLFQ
jgi:RNA polymerase sigma-70 factor (ECF subfamily)